MEAGGLAPEPTAGRAPTAGGTGTQEGWWPFCMGPARFQDPVSLGHLLLFSPKGEAVPLPTAALALLSAPPALSPRQGHPHPTHPRYRMEP